MTIDQWLTVAVLFSFCCSIGWVVALCLSQFTSSMSAWLSDKLVAVLVRCGGKGNRR